MRFTALIAATLAASTAYAASTPRSASEVAAAFKDQLTFMMKDDEDPCPDLKVLCIKKDNDGNEEVVGDIGKQSFCHKGGLSCGQCHTKKNEAECNAKFPVQCALKCYSQGSPL